MNMAEFVLFWQTLAMCLAHSHLINMALCCNINPWKMFSFIINQDPLSVFVCLHNHIFSHGE